LERTREASLRGKRSIFMVLYVDFRGFEGFWGRLVLYLRCFEVFLGFFELFLLFFLDFFFFFFLVWKGRKKHRSEVRWPIFASFSIDFLRVF
jgi:hypothetical protein